MLLLQIGLLMLQFIDLASKTDHFISHLVHRLVGTTTLILHAILGLLEALLLIEQAPGTLL